MLLVVRVYDAVLGLLRAQPGYRSPSSPTSGIPVYDGPEIETGSGPEGVYVVLGRSSPAEEDTASATTTTAPGPLSPARQRDETGVLYGCVIAQTGDTDPSGARASAASVVETLEAAVRASVHLGLTPGTTSTMTSWMTTGSLTQWATPDGAVVEISFTIGYQGRLR